MTQYCLCFNSGFVEIGQNERLLLGENYFPYNQLRSNYIYKTMSPFINILIDCYY